MLEELRQLLREEVFSRPSFPLAESETVHRRWEGAALKVNRKLDLLRRKYLRRFGINLLLVPISVFAAVSGIPNFPEWLATALGSWSVRDIAALRGEYEQQRKELIGKHPQYFLVQPAQAPEKASTQWLRIDSHPLLFRL